MSKPANPALIGSFVLSALALLVAALMMFGGERFSKDSRRFIIVFDGNAKGLQVGAPVVLKGVRVGQVSSIQVGLSLEAQTFYVPVVVEVEPGRVIDPDPKDDLDFDGDVSLMITAGLRARLAMQSLLTGQLMVELDFFPDSEALYRDIEHEYLEIPSVPSSLEELERLLTEIPLSRIMTSLLSILEGADRLINSDAVNQTIENVRQATADIRVVTAILEQRAAPLLDNIDGAVGDVRSTLHGVDEGYQQLIADLRGLSSRLDGLVTHLDPALRDAAASVDRAGQTAVDAFAAADRVFASADRAFVSADSLVGEQSPVRAEALQLMRTLTDAARSLKNMADYLERHPEALIKGKRPGG